MKRDLDLIRTILLAAEAAAPAKMITNSDIDVPDDQGVAVSEHIELLANAGFVEANISKELSPRGPRSCHIHGITWQGYEYLDSVRDPEIWRKTKGKIMEVGGSVSIDMVKTIATHFLKSTLGIG